MMELITLGSGSSGNCYLLNSEDKTLVIEAGLPFLEVKKALDFNIDRIVGVLVTHVHGDHAKYAHEYEKAGIPVWKPYDDKSLRQNKRFGEFTVASFEQKHNVPCVGYLVTHPDGLKLLYSTDTSYIRYTFHGLTTMLIEANWSEEYVNRDEPKYAHVLQHHTSLNTCLECIKANANPDLSHVILCHLSGGNAYPEAFQKAAEAVVDVGVTVDIATPGKAVNLDAVPF